MRSSLPKILMLLLTLFACGKEDSNSTPAHRFISFLNEYEADSLDKLLTEDFKLVRTFADYSNDKASLLDRYLSHSKNFNAKYKILKTLDNGNPVRFLVEDQSDYLKYLGIHPPTWEISVLTEGDKVHKVTIDTTDAYHAYMSELRSKGSAFDLWLKETYPEEAGEILISTEGLMVKRLKEYSEQKK